MGRSVSTALLWPAKRDRFSEQLGVQNPPGDRGQRFETAQPGGNRLALT